MAVVLIIGSLIVGILAAIMAWPLGWFWLLVVVPAVTSISALLGAVLIAYGQSRQTQAPAPFAQAFQQLLSKLNLR
jgi:ABC-type multidrug transport system permease subunit